MLNMLNCNLMLKMCEITKLNVVIFKVLDDGKPVCMTGIRVQSSHQCVFYPWLIVDMMMVRAVPTDSIGCSI